MVSVADADPVDEEHDTALISVPLVAQNLTVALFCACMVFQVSFDTDVVKGRHCLMIDDLVDSGLTMQTVQQKLLEAGEKRLCQHPARQQACCDLLLIGLLAPGDALWSSLHLHHCSVVISCCLMPVQG